jgi:VPDSG-CTERM motif
LLCMVLCAAALAVSHNANALSVGDSHELGFLWPGAPIGNQNNATYVNHLIGMALGGFDIANGQIYFRSNNTFGPLPTAVAALNGTGTTINLGAGGVYTYLFASYSGLGAEVWYVGDLHGVITIPAIFNLCGLTKWTLFRPGGAGVPDGGTTAILLGAALGALGMARRVLRI